MIVQTLSEAPAIAIVRGGEVDVSVWRRRLDKLQYPSIEFECLDSFFTALESGRRFFMALVSASEVKDSWNKISKDGIQMLLIVNENEWNKISIKNKEYLNPGGYHYINSNANELEWRFRTQLLFNFASQKNTNENLSLKSQLKNDFHYKKYEILVLDRRILCGGRDTFLNHREYEVAALLFLNAGRVLPRYWLLKLVWGEENTNSRALDVCVSRLREKLHLDRQNIILRSVYRKGYQLLDPGEANSHHHSLSNIVSGEWVRTSRLPLKS
ncbi:winged helix-turn-helix domain-containing protein [Comamonas testosteroni]|uniref:winged helix-turn-helix domain-containing protein n=2 Tax=Comamonas testosteroni TaxID=285 RepID=UPI002E148DD1|nr:winged helix-turn-helix domain-containing protein [Comamonas testosteroni]